MSNDHSENYKSTLILGQKSMSGGVQENNRLNQNQVQIIKRNKNSILWFTHIMSYALEYEKKTRILYTSKKQKKQFDEWSSYVLFRKLMCRWKLY